MLKIEVLILRISLKHGGYSTEELSPNGPSLVGIVLRAFPIPPHYHSFLRAGGALR